MIGFLIWGLDTNLIFNHVESNPSIETTSNIIEKFKNQNFSTVVGLGGGSVLDVAKFVGFKLKNLKFWSLQILVVVASN